MSFNPEATLAVRGMDVVTIMTLVCDATAAAKTVAAFTASASDFTTLNSHSRPSLYYVVNAK